VVEGLASYLLDTALDPYGESPAARCGAIRTDAVKVTTTVLLLRHRYDINVASRSGPGEQLLAEDVSVAGFAGSPADPTWLSPEQTEVLLAARPAGNVLAEQRSNFVRQVVRHAEELRAHLESIAQRRAEDLADAHRRARRAAGTAGRVAVRAHLPVDVLGIYVYLPV
jgi:hypothetical protein